MSTTWKIPPPTDYFDPAKTIPVPITEIVVVNGKVARDMLDHNQWHLDNRKVDARQPGNRKVSNEHLDGLIDTLLAGDWQLTHQGVAFDAEGNLVDGQHRLAAILTASATEPNISATLQVTYHLSPTAFRALDIGRRRTAGDMLSISGESSTNQLAAVVRLVIVHDKLVATGAPPVGKPRVPTVDEVFDKLNAEPVIREVVNAWVSKAGGQTTRRFMTPSAIYATHYLLRRAGHSPSTIERFWEGVFEGANLGITDSRLALRNNMTNARRGRKRTVALAEMALAVKAFNAWVAGRYIHQLVWRSNETVPTVISAEDVGNG